MTTRNKPPGCNALQRAVDKFTGGTVVWVLDVHRSPSFPYEGGWSLHGIYSTREKATAAAAALPRGREGDVDKWRIEGRRVDATPDDMVVEVAQLTIEGLTHEECAQLVRRCRQHELVDALLCGERLAIEVDFLDRRRR